MSALDRINTIIKASREGLRPQKEPQIREIPQRLLKIAEMVDRLNSEMISQLIKSAAYYINYLEDNVTDLQLVEALNKLGVGNADQIAKELKDTPAAELIKSAAVEPESFGNPIDKED